MAAKSINQKSTKKIIVTGDVAIDWLEISTPPDVGDNKEIVNNWQTYPEVKRFARPGGALLLAKFVQTATGGEILSPELRNVEKVATEKILHSFVKLDKFPYSTAKKDEKNIVYRVGSYQGNAASDKRKIAFLPVKNDDPNADIVVLDDACNGFREAKSIWPVALEKGKKPIVVIKVSRPLAKGPLWEVIQEHHTERLVVVVSADDLRQEGVKLSRRLSWERTAKDFVWQMASNPDLMTLNNCSCLIVRFGMDGAILYRRRDGIVESRLFFDPKIGEDGFSTIYPGNMLGSGCVFVAALTAKISQKGLEGIEEGVHLGLMSSRRLWQLGFGKNLAELDYPGSDIFMPLDNNQYSLADVVIPNPTATEPADPDYWCILGDLIQSSLEDVAYNFVIYGKDNTLDKVPIGQFRNLRTFDRSEIESFRSIKNLIQEYISSSKKTMGSFPPRATSRIL